MTRVRSWLFELLWAFIGMILICSAGFILVRIWEWILPVRFWFEYQSVVPTKTWYKIGEPITLVSTMERKRPIKLQRQDFLICEVDGTHQKLSTQYRPVLGNEYAPAWIYITPREYNLPIPILATKCKVVGSAIGKTKHNREKTYSYFTDTFLVNLPLNSWQKSTQTQ